MSHFNDYCDALTQETLLEMADNFFGERVSIEEESERFCLLASKLTAQRDQALQKAALVHAMLFTDENIHEYYYLLGVRPGRLFLEVDPAQARLDGKMPFAFTTKGRFIALFLQACAEQQRAFDAYMNGTYYTVRSEVPPDQVQREGYALGGANTAGSKRLSMHYKLLKDWAGHINRRIRKVNEGLAPSCVLGFAHGLNPEAVNKERITGATMDNYCCSLDESLEIPFVSCHVQGLAPLPELPDTARFKKSLAAFARQVFKAHRNEARELLQNLARGNAPQAASP